ncbi:hypothetical protein [Roseovarius sp.]|uniref:hypothetical protein n=1 Tax=Roseovarius sp. TaxID=1486281 RepID=UPI003569F45D
MTTAAPTNRYEVSAGVLAGYMTDRVVGFPGPLSGMMIGFDLGAIFIATVTPASSPVCLSLTRETIDHNPSIPNPEGAPGAQKPGADT